MRKYRIQTRLIDGSEEFNPQELREEWEDLKSIRWSTWYKTEKEARVAIENHKLINGYVPRIIEVE